MIRITSEYLKKADLQLMKRYARFVMLKMVKPHVLNKANISIKIIKRHDCDLDSEDAMDLKDYGAWVLNEGIVEGKKKFSIVLDARRLVHRGKKPITRLKRLMMDLGHELVHVKQYLNNELFDYVNGMARYRGELYETGHSPENDDIYYNSPWEIEAYGREFGFTKMFIKMYKKEQKEKNKK
jgi:hypothetical protein